MLLIQSGQFCLNAIGSHHFHAVESKVLEEFRLKDRIIRMFLQKGIFKAKEFRIKLL
jgi:hypothetical protein